MRVTTPMKEYITSQMAKKVAARLEAAEKAGAELRAADEAALKAVNSYAKSLIPEMTKKVAAFAKKQGLTWIEHAFTWCGDREDDENVAFSRNLGPDDFEETNSCEANAKSPRRRARTGVLDEPGRIRRAVAAAANAVVFQLELGKVKKAELEELLASTEVEL